MSGLMLLSKLTIYSGPILVASCWNCSLFGIGVSSLRHAPHTPGMWNRCEYRGTRKGRGLVTCGYASVIKHGELGNPQPKWRFTAVRWEKKMGDSPLPGLTTGGYILMRSFFPLLGCWCYRMVLNLHPLSGWSCEVSRVDAKWLVRQNEHFYKSGGFVLL